MSGAGGDRRPRERATAWMRCAYWLICDQCGQRIETGQWQALVDVPGAGRRWVHETCALELGATARDPDDSTPPAADAAMTAAQPVRIVVIGSAAWPRDRAVEVRDSIEAVARGHRGVVIVHGARRDPRRRLRGVDAWAALTAQRLGYTAEPHDCPAEGFDELRAMRPTVVVAFPLGPRPVEQPGMSGAATPDSPQDPVETLAAAAELAGVPVLVHRRVTAAVTSTS